MALPQNGHDVADTFGGNTDAAPHFVHRTLSVSIVSCSASC